MQFKFKQYNHNVEYDYPKVQTLQGPVVTGPVVTTSTLSVTIECKKGTAPLLIAPSFIIAFFKIFAEKLVEDGAQTKKIKLTWNLFVPKFVCGLTHVFSLDEESVTEWAEQRARVGQPGRF